MLKTIDSQNESQQTSSEVVTPSGLLGAPIGYVDLLDIATQEKLDKEAKEPVKRNPLRPSSMGKCAREKAYEYMEYRGYELYEKDPLTPSTSRIFSLGHSVEYDLLKQFQWNVPDLELKYKQQVLDFYKLHDGTMVEGSLDAVFIFPKWKCIIDVKSKGNKWSSFYSTKWEEDTEKLKRMQTVQTISDQAFWVEDLEAFLVELNDPFFRMNFVQLNGYAVNPFIKARGIDHAAIIQYCKNDSRLREIRFKPSEVLFAKIRDQDQQIALEVDTKKSPDGIDREYQLGSSKCAFCSFKKQCWGLGADPLKTYFRTLPGKFWPKDTDRLGENGGYIEQLFQERSTVEASTKELEKKDQEIIQALKNANVEKVRLSSKEVYEVKFYKSPYPRFVLKRSKT